MKKFTDRTNKLLEEANSFQFNKAKMKPKENQILSEVGILYVMYTHKNIFNSKHYNMLFYFQNKHLLEICVAMHVICNMNTINI